MTFIQSWRRFTFFDREVVKDPENPDQPFLGLQDMDLVSSSGSRGRIVLAEGNGVVYMVEPDWSIFSFKAYKSSLSHMCDLPHGHILVTVGSDEDGGPHLLKIWQLDKIDKQGIPFCSRISRLQTGANRQVPVTALAVHDSLQCMTVGFKDSSILLYRGDITRERSSNRPHLLRDGMLCASDGRIVGLAFPPSPSSVHPITLYVLTERMVLSYTFTGKEESKVVLDHNGCSDGCWVLGDENLKNEFVVVRSDAVYFYQPDCRGQCYVFEGDKSLVKTKGSYLVVVTKDTAAPGVGEDGKMDMITIYDIPHCYVAYSAPIPEVLDVIYEWGCFHVVSKNGKIYQLREKDIQGKLEILFRKGLYDLAVSLAKMYLHDEGALADIYRQHGDHLYKKNDFDNAVKQYIKTIGNLEASYVIRKFLDAQRIAQLTLYLEALHKANLANKDHTTILLNCYTKLSNSTKLEEFVQASNSGDVFFDVDTAIRVLKNAGYASEALRLAEIHQRHDQYLHIQLEVLQDYKEAVSYISKLEFSQAEAEVKRCGKVLLEHSADDTTDLIKKLCTGYDAVDGTGGSKQKAHPDEFIHIFVNDPPRLRQFLEHMINTESDCQPIMYNTLLELYLREYQEANAEDKLEKEAHIMQFLQKPEANYGLDHALVACQMNGFPPGMVYIYEKAGLFHQILLHYMDLKDFGKVIETCRLYGKESKHKDMWIEALWFFARNDDCPMHCIMDLLRHIDELNVLPPLMVLEILSHSNSVNLSVVKEYLLRWLKAENEKIQKDDDLIAQYKEEMQKTEDIIRDLETSGQVFQVSRCSACDHQLEVPTVHFLCKHSYHKHCFESYAENETECPVCLPEYKKLRTLISAQESNKDPYQQFHSELEKSTDGISTMADYFGRGIFADLSLDSRRTSSSTDSGAKRSSSTRTASSTNPFEPPKWYES